ncbi:MAG TPA: DUF2975 domain-containing protein [Verrucomicrobiae bacterium]
MKNFQNKTKIIKVSKIIQHILFAGLVLWVGLGIPIALLQAFNLWNKIGSPAALYLQGGAIVMLLLSFTVNLKLFRFFDRLKNGNLFDAQTIGYLAGAGKWWVMFSIVEGLFYAVGQEFFKIGQAWSFGGLFAGLTLIFVAWLLKEAQELQEEQELTV